MTRPLTPLELRVLTATSPTEPRTAAEITAGADIPHDNRALTYLALGEFRERGLVTVDRGYPVRWTRTGVAG